MVSLLPSRAARSWKVLVGTTVLVASSLAGATAYVATATAAQAATTLCNSQTAQVSGGSYIVQNNEWGSSANECITTDGNADFTVANSSISNGTSGSPGGYPSIYRGCHWGVCTTSQGGLPLQVSSMGNPTTSVSTTLPGQGAYDVAYDIWFNQTSTTSGQPNGEELMVWLNHNGSVQPFGSQVGTATIDGIGYNVWYGTQGWATVSYVMQDPTSSANLNIGDLARDSVSRGYMQSSWWLIDVEFGFELWQGGAGLAVNSFSVTPGNGGGGGGGTTTSTSASTTTTRGPTTTTTTGSQSGSCTASYTVSSQWTGGFTAAVTVTNGSTARTGWKVGWTYANGQTVSSAWNANVTQSGSSVTATNMSYNGSLAAGASTSFGFQGTWNGTNSVPTLSCS
jgi:cellulose 1,4-beta-cellobiosidase